MFLLQTAARERRLMAGGGGGGGEEPGWGNWGPELWLLALLSAHHLTLGEIFLLVGLSLLILKTIKNIYGVMGQWAKCTM